MLKKPWTAAASELPRHFLHAWPKFVTDSGQAVIVSCIQMAWIRSHWHVHDSVWYSRHFHQRQFGVLLLVGPFGFDKDNKNNVQD